MFGCYLATRQIKAEIIKIPNNLRDMILFQNNELNFHTPSNSITRKPVISYRRFLVV